MPKLVDANQEGVPLLVTVVTAELHQKVYAIPEILRVSGARQVRSLLAGDVEPVSHQYNKVHAGQGVRRLIDAGQGVRQVVFAEQEQLPDNR